MKILQICSKPPFPKKDGYALAVNHITDTLIQRGNNLKVIAISTPKHAAENIPKQYLKDTNFEYIFIDTSLKILPAFLNLFSTSSYNTNRFYSNNFSNRLKEILHKNSFDIILLEGLFLCPYFDIIKERSDAKILLRAHNIESDIWKGLAKQSANLFKKWYLNILQKKLFNYERKIVKKMDGIICISEKDTNWMKKQNLKEVITIPFGINSENKTISPLKKNTIFHIGSMDWISNQEGIRWFVDKVFPIIKKKKGNAILHLAGRSMPKSFCDIAEKNIVIDSEIENAKDYMKKHNLMIVPIWSGSGIRIKILEAMSLGKTIISTTIGASGIKYINKKDILIADNELDFAKKIIWCFKNPIESEIIGKNAKINIQENYSSLAISDKLDKFLNKIQTL